MKFFFILGRNPDLSKAELYSYLISRKIGFNEILFHENWLAINIEKDFEFKINELGGITAKGKLTEFDDKNALIDYLSENEFVPMDKFTYSIMGNIDPKIFSDKFKKERKKAQIKKTGKPLRIQSGKKSFLPKADAEIFGFFNGKKYYLGLCEEKYSSKESEERDMKKPFRRESLAISPRLARMLINLSGAKKNDLILDPFCGIGGIVQEAALKGINSVGIDKDSDAIKCAKQNLLWLKNKYGFNANYEFINDDSLNAKNRQYDAIAAEPSLGEVLRKKLAKKQAQEYLGKFKKQIIPLLKRFKEIKKRDAKIAITFPCFDDAKIGKKDIEDSTGLKAFTGNGIEFPIYDKKIGQFVYRQIWVFH